MRAAVIGIENVFNFVHYSLEKQLGSGQFGEVYKGRWGDKMVAVKQMKTGSSHEERVKFLQEAAIMAQFDNVNVVKMHGIVYQRNKVSTQNFVFD